MNCLYLANNISKKSLHLRYNILRHKCSLHKLQILLFACKAPSQFLVLQSKDYLDLIIHKFSLANRYHLRRNMKNIVNYKISITMFQNFSLLTMDLKYLMLYTQTFKKIIKISSKVLLHNILNLLSLITCILKLIYFWQNIFYLQIIICKSDFIYLSNTTHHNNQQLNPLFINLISSLKKKNFIRSFYKHLFVVYCLAIKFESEQFKFFTT